MDLKIYQKMLLILRDMDNDPFEYLTMLIPFDAVQGFSHEVRPYACYSLAVFLGKCLQKSARAYTIKQTYLHW